MIFILAINEILSLIRRQYEDVELEKQNFLLEQTSREQTFRIELEQLAAEKEFEKKTNQQK